MAYDAFRKPDVKTGPEIESLTEVLGIDISPLRQVMADELWRHIRECARHLPPKQQVVATMVWFPPPPSPAEVSLGQSPAQVVATLGEPFKKAKVGTKDIYFYKDMQVTFVNGKVTDIQ